jgi:hypothetical protein
VIVVSITELEHDWHVGYTKYLERYLDGHMRETLTSEELADAALVRRWHRKRSRNARKPRANTVPAPPPIPPD